MPSMAVQEAKRLTRHARIRRKIVGTIQRPRMVIHRSHQNLQIQMVDDIAGKTLFSCSTQDPEFRSQHLKGGNLEGAEKLGQMVAQAAKGAGIQKAVFDRGGYLYHGRVKAAAEAAREHGLEI